MDIHDPRGLIPHMPYVPYAKFSGTSDMHGSGPIPAYSAVYEDIFYNGRDIMSNNTLPQHPYHPNPIHSGMAGFAQLESRLKPEYTRDRAGSHLSLRNQPIPMGISFTPLHYETQLPDDIQRHTIHTRVEESKCPRPNPMLYGNNSNLFQVRSV